MALTLPPDYDASRTQGGVSSILPPPDVRDDDASAPDAPAAADTTPSPRAADAPGMPPSTGDLPALASPSNLPSRPTIKGRGDTGGMRLRSPAPPGTPPAEYVEAFKDEAMRKAEQTARAEQDAWVDHAIREISHIHRLMDGRDADWAGIQLPPGVDVGQARRTTVVDAYLRVFLKGGEIPSHPMLRDVLRFQVSHLMFNGRGADSDDAFLREIRKDTDAPVAHGPRAYDAIHFHGGGLKDRLTTLARLSALPGTVSFRDARPPGLLPSSATMADADPAVAQISRMMKARRIYGPQALGRGVAAMEEMEKWAYLGRIFEHGSYWRDEDAWQMYRTHRDAAAMEYGIPPEDLDDVIRHRVDMQEDGVSRDAFGQIHFKQGVVIQGVDAMRRAVESSALTPQEKQLQLHRLPERYREFQQGLVTTVMEKMPELAAELGIRSVDDFHKIPEVLNDNAWAQGAGGALAAADKSIGGLNHLLGYVEGWVTPGDGVPYLERRSQAQFRRSQANDQINALSHLFRKEQTSFLGVNAALIGQGVWSGAESFAMVTVTAPMVPEIVLARYGRLATAFNAAAKVAPAAGVFAIRQGFATYDEAIEAGKTTEEAMRLAWTSGIIEGATTVAFSAIPGAGGLEDIASGSAREAFRQSLRGSVRSAWKEGAKAFGKSILGEVTEEEFIAALDAAFVQMEIHPEMTSGEFMKRLYDTAVATVFGTGGFSAAHGRRVFKDVMGDGGRIAAELEVAERGETASQSIETEEEPSLPLNRDFSDQLDISQNSLPDSTLRALAQVIEQDLPNVTILDGANGLLDAPWARDAVVMPDLLPIVFEGIGPGFSDEHRSSVFQSASDVQLLALGISPGDVSTIRSALTGNPAAGVKAIDEAFSRLDANSEIALSALKAIQISYYADFGNGDKPYRLTATPDGKFKVENDKGKVLAIAPDYRAMARIRKYLAGKKVNPHEHTAPDYSVIPDPVNLLSSSKPTERQVRQMKQMNFEHNNQSYRDDWTGEVVIKSQKSTKT